MDAGWIVSLIVVGIWMVIILGIMIPLERKHIVRKNGKIDYNKTTIYLRWNVFDTLTIALVIYTIICVQALNLLISSGQTVDNVYVQFFTNQSQAWTIIAFIYLLLRLSNTLKSIRARYGGSLE